MTTPVGWHAIDMGHLTQKIGSGATPRGGRQAYGKTGVPLIRSMNVHFGGLKRDGLAFLDARQSAALDNVAVEAGDVLLNITGASIGRVCLAPADMAGARVNQHVSIIRCSEAIIPSYVEKFLASPQMQQFIIEENYGFTRQALTKGMIEAMVVPVPPLAEQRRIVTKLDALTARITRAQAELDTILHLAAAIREAVLSLAIKGDLTFEWRADRLDDHVSDHLDVVRSQRSDDNKLSRRLQASAEPSELPAAWAWVSPDEVADDARYSLGIGPFGSNLVQSDYRSEGIRLVFVRDIIRQRFDDAGARFVSPDKAATLSPHTLSGGEVLITKMGNPPGDTALYPPGHGEAIITADCVKLKPHPNLATAQYLVYAIRSGIVKSQIIEITAGVAHQKISLERFRTIAIPIPPLEEQTEIVARLEAAFARADRLEAEAARARTLLDRLESALLTKAFRGELVPQDPNDEPASVLLDRILASRATQSKPSRERQPRAASAPRQPRAKAAMTKTRTDSDVRHQPYLANLLRQVGGSARAEALFKDADLSVPDFYKQLAWEIEAGHIKDGAKVLEAA